MTEIERNVLDMTVRDEDLRRLHVCQMGPDSGEGLAVDAAERLVEQVDVRCVEDGPRYGHSLNLATGQARAVLSEGLVEP